jgi:hypothetical protein
MSPQLTEVRPHQVYRLERPRRRRLPLEPSVGIPGPREQDVVAPPPERLPRSGTPPFLRLVLHRVLQATTGARLR